MDEKLRGLERAARAGDPAALGAWLTALARSGASAVQLRQARVVAEGIRRGQVERHATWEAIYETVSGPSPRGLRGVCMDWAQQPEAALASARESALEVEERHGIKLTKEQRTQLRWLWEDLYESGCYQATVADLRRVVPGLITLVNTAADWGRGDVALERHVRGQRRPAVLGWSEGNDAMHGPGVWFSLTRTMLFACRGVGRDCNSLRRVNGADVLSVARSWASAAGERLRVDYHTDPSGYVDYPSDEHLMAVVREAAPAAPTKKPRTRSRKSQP
jgi:hypothetical protein